MNRNIRSQTVKLAQEIGSAKAANELGIPRNTIYGWNACCAMRKPTRKNFQEYHDPQRYILLGSKLGIYYFFCFLVSYLCSKIRAYNL